MKTYELINNSAASVRHTIKADSVSYDKINDKAIFKNSDEVVHIICLKKWSVTLKEV